MKRLERASREDLESFTLLDGSRYYFDPSSEEIFLHGVACAKRCAHDWPEPPEVVRKLCEAKDVEHAAALVRGEGDFSFFVYDPEVLITERRLEPRPLASRYDPETGAHVPLDPFDEPIPDLSEP
jgi:hypothetical protein